MPPNSTHLTQPLDLAFFNPLKGIYRKCLQNYRLKNPGAGSLTKEAFSMLLKQSLDTLGEERASANLRAGFAKAGLGPTLETPTSPSEDLSWAALYASLPASKTEKVVNEMVDDTFMKLLHTKFPAQVAPTKKARNSRIAHQPGTVITPESLAADKVFMHLILSSQMP